MQSEHTILTSQIDGIRLVPRIKQKYLTILKYLGVYLLALIFFKVLCIIVAFAFFELRAHDWLGFTIVRYIIYSLIKIYAFIFIYNIFKTLNMKKFLPYLFGLTLLEMFMPPVEYFTAVIAVELLGFTRWAGAMYYHIYPVYYFTNPHLEFISLMIVLGVIESYYEKRPDRWYDDSASHKITED